MNPKPNLTRDWTTRDGKPVVNRDLWQRLDTLVGRHDVHWHVASRDAMPEKIERAKAMAWEALTGRMSDGD